jgi:DNA-binding MarR family transcriptional regulator
MLVWVVGRAVLPAAPDDVEPRAGEDAPASVVPAETSASAEERTGPAVNSVSSSEIVNHARGALTEKLLPLVQPRIIVFGSASATTAGQHACLPSLRYALRCLRLTCRIAVNCTIRNVTTSVLSVTLSIQRDSATPSGADAADAATGNTDLTYDAVQALRDVIVAGEHFRHRFAEYLGVGVTDAAAIGHLYSRGYLSLIELARHLDITPSSATAVMDRLESAGLATRRPSRLDRRVTTVCLSTRGHDAVTAGRGQFQAAFNATSRADLQFVADILATIATHVRDAADELLAPAR